MRILEYASGRKLDKITRKLLIDLLEANAAAEEANCLLERTIDRYRKFHARLVEIHEERVDRLTAELNQLKHGNHVSGPAVITAEDLVKIKMPSGSLKFVPNEDEIQLLREQVHVQSDRIVQLETALYNCASKPEKELGC
jgi:hypothetical protein